LTDIPDNTDPGATIVLLRAELERAQREHHRLTRELHHRVRNNLQIVSSLLALTARDAEDPALVSSLADIAARVDTLTRAQHWIYEDVTQRGVDLQALVSDLCTGLERRLKSQCHRRVRMRCLTAGLFVSAELAVPISFLLTEFAGLAARHGVAGPLHVALALAADADRLTLAVASRSFVGHDYLMQQPDQPAARLILGMVRQLGGSLAYDGNRGRYSITFARWAGSAAGEPPPQSAGCREQP
jgi:two-component sensor histidine kinase